MRQEILEGLLAHGEAEIIKNTHWYCVGGGQLALMMAEAAACMGFPQLTVLDPTKDCPASFAGARQILGDFKDPKTIRQLASNESYRGIYGLENLDSLTRIRMQNEMRTSYELAGHFAEVFSASLHLADEARWDQVAIIIDDPSDPYVEKPHHSYAFNILVPRVAPKIETVYPQDETPSYQQVNIHPAWQKDGVIMGVGGLNNAVLFALQLIGLANPRVREVLAEIDQNQKEAVFKADQKLQNI